MPQTDVSQLGDAIEYESLGQITHKGYVLCFAQRRDGRTFYSVSRRSSEAEAVTYPLDSPRELPFPGQLFSSSCVGRVDVVTLPPAVASSKTAGTAAGRGNSFWSTTARFGAKGSLVVVSDESEVYVFRQSCDDNGETLYRTTSGGSSADAKADFLLDTEGKQVPVVTGNSILVDRFVLIKEELVGKQYLAKNLELAREPTAELNFIRNVAMGQVAVNWVDTGRVKRWRIDVQNAATGLRESLDVQRDVNGAYTEIRGLSEKASSSENAQEFLRARTPAAVTAVLRRVWHPSGSNPHSTKIGIILGLRDGTICGLSDRIPKSSVGVLKWEGASLKDRFAAADLLTWYVTSWPVSRKCLKESLEEILVLCENEIAEVQCGALRAIRNLAEHSKQCSKLIQDSKRLPSFFPLPLNLLSISYLNDIIHNFSHATNARFSPRFTEALLQRKATISNSSRIGVGIQVFLALSCFLGILVMVAFLLMGVSQSMGMTVGHLERLTWDIRQLERERVSAREAESKTHTLSILGTLLSHAMHLFSKK